MGIGDEARRNHDALFPDHRSTLKVTDPELVELFDNWAFGEVPQDDGLAAKTRVLVQLAALVASHAVAEYRVMLRGALNVGVTPTETKELVYQAVAYVGMGRLFDILLITNEVLQEHGVPLPLPPQSTTGPGTHFEKGRAVQRRLFGERIDRMEAEAPEDQKHVQRYLAANCFGDYLTRTGLDLKTRELLTFAMIASLGGCEPQLAAHVAANLAAGNDRCVLVGAVTAMIPFVGYPRSLNALRIVNEGTAA